MAEGKAGVELDCLLQLREGWLLPRAFERKILRGGELLVWSVKNAKSVLNASDSANHQFRLSHTLISISVIGAALHKARLDTAPRTGCERAHASGSCSDRWRLRGLYPIAPKICEDMVEHAVSGRSVLASSRS